MFKSLLFAGAIAASHAKSILEIVANSTDHTILEAVVVATGLNGTLAGSGTFTVFAPTDAAFMTFFNNSIPDLTDPDSSAVAYAKELVLTHALGVVVEAGDIAAGTTYLDALSGVTIKVDKETNVMVNDATVTGPDVMADNGVVHVVDAVVSWTNIVDIVGGADFSVLLAALIKAELADAIINNFPNKMTIFAPNNAAFAKLNLTADNLPSKEDLTPILLNHVVNETQAWSQDVSDGAELTALGGGMLTFSVGADGVFINTAEVTDYDNMFKGGVVHVIDSVLLPSTDATTTMAANTTMPASVTTAATSSAVVVGAGIVSCIGLLL